MIRYKVVTRRKRKSFLAGRLGGTSKRYTLTYNKGHIVTAPEGTLGIFTFTDLGDAQMFGGLYFSNLNMIIKVRGIGKGTKPKCIGFWTTFTTIFNFYKEPKFLGSQLIPRSTMCYPAVEVLT